MKGCHKDRAHRSHGPQVTLDDGEVLSYSKLLLATGTGPKRPDFPGAELPHLKLLRSLEDCRDILAVAQAARHIACGGQQLRRAQGRRFAM
jgi:NAD(P)H-nitrite reductase large subunit